MLTFFDKLYGSIKDKNSFLKKIRFYSAERFIIRKLANFALPIYFRFTANNPNNSLYLMGNGQYRIIVSLTSFPIRIKKVWLVIETILRQSQKPDAVVLWLSKEQFPSWNTLPTNLLKLRKRGLRIELKDGDLLSHKKYYYALREFPNDIIITVDDDVFYPTGMIENLMKWHHKFANTVVARYGNKIKVVNKSVSKYQEWEVNFEQTAPDFSVFFGSGGGTLFPPDSLPAETLNKQLFMNLCLYADDIWLNTMCRLNYVKIFRAHTCQCSLLPILNKKNSSLYTQNIGKNLNDIQLKKVRDYFIFNKGIDPYSEILK